ncbi:hypothetical protein FOZ63_018968, partial [Perkinsus olseni]
VAARYAKSYYRRAVGQSELGNVEAAVADLKEVKRLSTKHQWKHCEARMLRRKLRQGGGRLIFPTVTSGLIGIISSSKPLVRSLDGFVRPKAVGAICLANF